MRPYLAILSARFRTLLQYRAAAAAGFGTQVFFGMVRAMIFTAFYHAAAGRQPMDLPQVVTYVWLGQAFLMLLPWRGDAELEAMILSGDVVYQLLRPVDLYAMWYARSIAQRVAPTTLRCLPMLLVAWLLLGMRAPPSLGSLLAFLAATAGAVLLSAAFTTLMTLCMLWTLSGKGIQSIALALANAFSGIIIPLPLFPGWLQPLLRAMPFAGLMDLPFRLYMGHLRPGELPGVLALQLGWTAAIVLLGRWLLRRGLRRLVVQGG